MNVVLECDCSLSLEFIPSRRWSQCCCCFPFEFLKNHLNISDTYVKSIILRMSFRKILFVCTKTQLGRVPIGTSLGLNPQPIGTNPTGMGIPNGLRNGATNVPIRTIFPNQNFSLIDVCPMVANASHKAIASIPNQLGTTASFSFSFAPRTIRTGFFSNRYFSILCSYFVYAN